MPKEKRRHGFYHVRATITEMKKVFVVDERFSVIQSLSRWFISKGCEVRAFSKPLPLFDALHESLPDMIVIDADLADEDGERLYVHLKTEFSEQIPMVLFSSVADPLKKVRKRDTHYNLLPQGFTAC